MPRPRPKFRPTLERLEDRFTPSFAAQVTFAVVPDASAAAVADFNGDGRPDFAVVNDDAPGVVSVLLNAAAAGATSPAFAAQVTFPMGTSPTYLATGDFNGDGRPDLLTANYFAGTASVLLNTTPVGASVPSFAAQQTFAVGAYPSAVAVGDFNGDGKPDLAVANNPGTASIILNTTPTGATAAAFAAPVTFAAGASLQSVAVGDFNGDRKPDVVVGDAGGTVSVLLDGTPAGASAPAFTPQQTFAVGSLPYTLAVGDFNGDGRPDIAAANENDATVSVLLNTAASGTSAASFTAQKTFAVGATPDSIAVGDFDGDGRPDLITTNLQAGTVSVLRDATAAQATVAAFAAQQTYAVGAVPEWAAVGDFNGDGRPDVAAANDGGTASFLLNTTAPFAATTPAVVGDLPGLGVVEYIRATGAWVQLNPANPSDVSLLAVDAYGDVFADYTGYGVFRYVPSVGSWRTVNGTDAVALAVDAAGDAFASFAGAGIGVFRLDGSSRQLAPSAATLLAADASGDLVGEFPGYGVMRRTAFEGVWRVVNGQDAEAVAIDGAGDVFASFAGAGTAVFRRDGSSQLLTPSSATLLASDSTGDLVGEFAGYGVYRRQASAGAWANLNGEDAAAVAIDAVGDVFASFAGAGTAEFRLYGGGGRVSPSAAALLAADPFGDPSV